MSSYGTKVARAPNNRLQRTTPYAARRRTGALAKTTMLRLILLVAVVLIAGWVGALHQVFDAGTETPGSRRKIAEGAV